MARRAIPKLTARPSSRVRIVLLGWFALSIGVLLILRAAHIGLGQGSFAYLFSERQGQRMLRALWLVPIAGVVVGALALAARGKKLATPVALLAIFLLSIWTFFAPFQPIVQHSFNLRSPSHDGAFVNEIYGMTTLRAYLRDFDARIQQSPAELRGTRVISNPPGLTILFYAVPYLWTPDAKSPGWFERILIRHYDVEGDALVTTMVTIQIAALLTLMWLVSAIVLYRVARLFLPPVGAMLCVLIMWFNPSTAHFVPGKDPAQLLTVALMLWTWLIAWKRDRMMVAAICGAITLLGTTIGLIHLWIALALIITSAWDSPKRTLRLVLSFALGGFAILIVIYFLFDWNVAKTLFTVWRRFSQIQRELALSHVIWFVIGLPLFLLFVSPTLTLFATAYHRRNLGRRLALVTLITMALSYLLGVTYELPRLWVVFLPLLTLGFMSAAPLAQVRHDGRALRAAIFIAVAHVLFTAAHWSMLDARESEHRLSGDEPAFFGKT